MSENRKPQDCVSMDEVRVEIDRLDHALVDLLTERFGYVDRAWQLKANSSEALVPWRVQQVIDKVRVHSADTGLPPDFAEHLWRQMIGWFIEYEEEKMAARDDADGNT